MDLIVGLLDNYVRGAARAPSRQPQAWPAPASLTSSGGKLTAPCSPMSSTRPATRQQPAWVLPRRPSTAPLADPARSFKFGLQRIIDGIEAFITEASR